MKNQKWHFPGVTHPRTKLWVTPSGQTARQWRETHPAAEGNIRDHALLEQLVVLTDLERLNSVSK